ncbi:MAG TPA: very short patch repair endonuclease [Thermoanaerobaculia bacterium]|nr:very short patch repair endonuclease [Thermoanaerobaculia bacterium]
MADTVSPEVRSRMMSRIRSKDTSPEVAVRSFLHRQGLRFRKNDKRLPGRPDAVFPKYRTVLFVHGCFWHQHPGCREGRIPGSNRDYWEPKLRRTVERDSEHRCALEKRGWRVITSWECEIAENQLLELARQIAEPRKNGSADSKVVGAGGPR